MLKIAMSHAVNREERAWDRGLRGNDLVAFIQCVETDKGKWTAADRLALFRVKDMRASVESAGLTRMKATSEGSEIQLVWPATIPQQPGLVSAVTGEFVETVLDSGRRQRYRLQARRRAGGRTISYRLHHHVTPGAHFGPGDTIMASVMPESLPPVRSSDDQYDFVADLLSEHRETVYAAVKALGFLPELEAQSVDEIRRVVEVYPDALVRLEGAAALARLGLSDGWDAIGRSLQQDGEVPLRMEAVLVLGEIQSDESVSLLTEVAGDRSNPSELRAAAAWSMGTSARLLDATPLLKLLADEDELVAVHALVSASRLMNGEGLALAFSHLGDDARVSAGVVRAILAARIDPVPLAVSRLRQVSGTARSWLLYLLAMLGRDRCEPHLRQYASDLIGQLDFFWTKHVQNWTNRFEVADQIDYQLAQAVD
ncbi:MAG: HEAT repeat domain-containing protein [Phycisphaerae bacterium]|nr:HEAT repeat domain-containing protein [Phycisphaerae bacterium]